MRDWWLRTLLVLQHPRPVFVALRDESRESLSDRAEPILAVVLLSGIAGTLASSTASHFLDDPSRDDLVVAVWAFIAGAVAGTVAYFVLGAVLHLGVKLLGSQGSYRRSRQLLAFASVPIALSLVVWPVKLALYGNDVFRTGGRDAGAGAHVFAGIELAFVVWAAALTVVGVRAVHGWSWTRAASASVLVFVAAAVLALY